MALYSAVTSLDRRSKQIFQVFYDGAASAIAFWLACKLNLQPNNLSFPIAMGLVAGSTLLVPISYGVAGVYRTVVRYMAGSLSVRILVVTVLVSQTLSIAILLISGHEAWRFGIDYGLLLLFGMLLPRVLLRWWAERYSLGSKPVAIIYGAGAAGRQLLNSVRSSGELRVYAFMDDDPSLAGSSLMGIPVHPAVNPKKILDKYGATTVLLAMPSAGLEKRKQTVTQLERLNIRVMSVPGLVDILSGRASISELREVAIEDLLGREPVKPNGSLIGKDITGKVVLVTGAGGSIGSELCRQALLQRPETLVLFEVGEYVLYCIESELKELAEKHAIGTELVAVLGTVQDRRRMTDVMKSHSVNTVYHAAAYKHVPLVEQNPTRAITNNVLGTWRTAKAALAAKVESFTLVSTDKAVRPTNVMGASKRLAELGVQAIAERAKNEAAITRFSMVRFGNVLGSSGSVVPKFRQQIKEGGPITVTHPDIIRYFMTIPEAAQLVIQAGAMAEGGEVFVLDMGEPVKIANLAERMLHLSGLTLKDANNPSGDIEIVFTGLRPGEKLFEELLVSGEELPTTHERICRTMEPALEYQEWLTLLNKLKVTVEESDLETLRELILSAPVYWTPDAEELNDVGVIPQNQ